MCYGFHCAWRRWIASSEGKIRKNPCALAHIIQMHRIKISERTDPSHRCYPWFSLNACGRREAMSTWNPACVGTVFQTAVHYAVIIPRLRPGLLSLCSVLSSRQILLFCCFVDWQCCRRSLQTTRLQNNKTTKQPDNQTTNYRFIIFLPFTI